MNYIAYTLPELLDHAAKRWPDQVAVRCDGKTITYEKLLELSRKVQRNLVALNCQRGDRIAFCMEKSIESVAIMIGICRAACVYVPIEKQTDAKKIEHILQDCAARLLIVDDFQQDLTCHRTINVKGLTEAGIADIPSISCNTSDLDIAYILYTSGSTGVPKGVAVTHRAAFAFLNWANDEFKPQASDVFANHASFAFDLSVLDIYLPMFGGGAAVLIPKTTHIRLGELTDLISREQITVWYSVPSVLILMARHGDLLSKDTSSLRLVLFAGEPFPVRDLRPIFEKMSGSAKFCNLYGPTETNVCSFHQVIEIPTEESAQIPIGRECSGNHLYALDVNGDFINAAGQVGVLWVDGPSVMAGYWGKLAYTSRHCTGDLVTMNSRAEFIYLGRQDQLVKIRGVRLSLLAVENAIQAFTSRDVCAVAIGSGADAKLVALVAEIAMDSDEFLTLQFNCRNIPKPERPDLLLPVENIPRNENGKIDRLVYRISQPENAR